MEVQNTTKVASQITEVNMDYLINGVGGKLGPYFKLAIRVSPKWIHT